MPDQQIVMVRPQCFQILARAPPKDQARDEGSHVTNLKELESHILEDNVLPRLDTLNRNGLEKLFCSARR